MLYSVTFLLSKRNIAEKGMPRYSWHYAVEEDMKLLGYAIIGIYNCIYYANVAY